MFTVIRMDDLEVFDRGLGDTPVEVQHVRLSLFIPARRFVHQGDQFVRVAVGVARQQGVKLLKKDRSSISNLNRNPTGFRIMRIAFLNVQFSDGWTLFHRSPAYRG